MSEMHLLSFVKDVKGSLPLTIYRVVCRPHKYDSQYCVSLRQHKGVTINTNKTSWAPKQNLEAPHKQD